MSDFDDKEILEKFRDPETKHYAFNLLVERYQQRLYWSVRRLVIDHDDSNDVVQNVFIKVWNNLDKFREASQLYTWLYRIATNESLTFLKKKRTKFFLPLNDVEGELSEKIRSDEYIDGNEIQLKLQQAILTLPDKQRIVFNMRYFEEMPYTEMAKVLGTSVGALKASYHHAAKKIEKFLKDD
ncbi:MAG: sigma-70 family RNA polymerase sigma factor [Bacteroidetes bacterium]|nr:sigma-70 family RNA polymerase sigma factor [Bacteroidota bacterium]